MPDLETAKEQIRRSVDLVELISGYVALRRAGKDFRGLCPFHQEKTPSLYVSPAKMIFKCFGCGAGGDVFTFVQLKENVGFGEALRLLADRAGVDLPVGRGAGSGVSRADLFRVNQWAAQWYQERLGDPRLGRAARAYLDQRGIPVGLARRFGLGLAADGGTPLREAARQAGWEERLLVTVGLLRADDRGPWGEAFHDRLMFPIRDSMKRVVGFSGRTLGNHPAKYINTAQNAVFDKGACLYGIDLSREAMVADRRAVVVEGYTDCIAAHQRGIRETVATMGTALTDAHATQLRRYCDEIVLLFDGDQAGQTATDRALAVALKQDLQVRIARIPEGKDPADFLQHCPEDEFRQLLNSAPQALAFRWSQVRDAYGGDPTGPRRRQAIEEFVGLVASLSRFGTVDAIQQGLIANEIANLLGLRRELAYELLEKRGVGGAPAATTPGKRAARPTPRSRQQAALIEILEVLVNEPELYPSVADALDPEALDHADERALARIVMQWCERSPSPLAHDLLDRVEDPALASLLADLIQRGHRRGNHAATVASAAEALRRQQAMGQAQPALEALSAVSPGPNVAEQDEERFLVEAHAALACDHQFADRRRRNHSGATSAAGR